MAKKMKKLFSLVLALSMVMSLMSVMASAEGTACGMGEHTHGGSCYAQQLDCAKHECAAECAVPCEQTLVCNKEVHAHDACTAHAHSNACCAIAEEGHEHSEACYAACSKEYDCGKEAYAHTDACYEAHTHGDTCYKTVLTCTTAEHTHTSGCAYGLGVVAIIDDATYTSLKAAVDAANANEGADTIVLVDNADFDSSAALSVAGDLTISGAKTISRGSYTGTMFTIPAGSSLTLDGGIVFDGSNNWIFNKALYENDLYNRINNTIDKYAYSANGGTCGTAATFVVNGTLNAYNATIQNFFNTKDSNGGDGAIFKVNANAVLNMEGATVNHVATYGANAVAHLATNAKWYIKNGTMISNNFGGRNGGVCRNDSGQIYMSGGTVKDNAGKNVNGTFVMLYGTGSQLILTGGTICSNSSVFGVNNGRCAAVYLHSSSYMKMTGGTICHNIGGSRGGIDSYAQNSVLDINRVDQTFVDGVYANENGTDSYNPDNHPVVVDNVSLIGNSTHDVGRTYTTESWWITGGIYTQDVDKFCAKGYVCIPYEDSERTDDYIVVPGYRVNYYAVEEVETTDAETGEPVTDIVTTLVYKYFHMLPRDKFWYEMDEKSEYYKHVAEDGKFIDTWYTEKELTNVYGFGAKLESDLDLYGEWEVRSNTNPPYNPPVVNPPAGGEEIEDPDVPMEEAPVEEETEFEEPEVPTTDAPEVEELGDEDVPLADVPATGDMTALWAAASVVSAAGVLFLGKKNKDEE